MKIVSNRFIKQYEDCLNGNHELFQRNKRLEKALDKAIKQLIYMDNLIEITSLSYRTNHLTEAEWKEWCLKDE